MIMKRQDIQQMQSSQAITTAIVDLQASVQAELAEYKDSYSQDQIDWERQVQQHFQRIMSVLKGIGSADTLIGPEWEDARNWSSVYISLFLTIDASLGRIRSLMGDRIDTRSLSASKLVGEIMKGHYLFWLSRSGKSDWTFPVKSVRDGLRKAKKLETTDRLEQDSDYSKISDQLVAHTTARIGEDWDFFAAHILCLKAAELEAKKSQDARRWLARYNTDMSQLSKSYGKSLREGSGAKGFGFRNGSRLTAGPGGTYLPVREVSA